MSTLGERILKIRTERGMTQEELAKQAYISSQVISNLERGKTKTASDSVLNLIAFTLSVTPDFLLGKSENPNMNKEGLIVPIATLPPWDYDYEIKTLMAKHSKNRDIEKLLREIVYYLTYSKEGDYGVKILNNVIEIIDKGDDKVLEVLAKITESIK